MTKSRTFLITEMLAEGGRPGRAARGAVLLHSHGA